MSTEETTTTPNKNINSEIDVLDLMSKFGRWIKKLLIACYNLVVHIFVLFITFILYLAKKWLWVGTSIVLGIAVGFLFYSTAKPYYTSEMIAYSNSISNRHIVNAIKLLNNPISVDEENYDVAAAYLGLPVESIEQIKSIKAGYGIVSDRDGFVDWVDYDDEFDPEDTTAYRLEGYFYTQVEVYDESLMDKVETGILNYLYRNKYLSDMNKNRIKQYEQRIGFIDREIEKLDSLQHIMYFETPKIKSTIPTDKLVFMNEIDQKLYHHEILSLKQSKLDIQREMEVRGDAITIIQPFTPTASRANTLLSYVIKWTILLFLLGLLTSVFWDYRKEVWGILFNKQKSASAMKDLDNMLKIKNEE